MRLIFVIVFLFSITCCGENVRVKQIIDGDTFETEGGEKVRLIGLNAPEISDLFGLEAKQYLKFLIEGKIVELRTDEESNNRDRYNRLLRYVFIEDIDINRKMIEQGLATAYLKYKFSKASDYKQVQLISRSENLGMWGNTKIDFKGQTTTKEKSGQNLHYLSKGKLILVLVIILVGIGIYGFFRN